MVTERILIKRGHIYSRLLFEKFGPNSPVICSPRAGAKTAFWNRLWTLTEHIFETKQNINNRIETCQSSRTSLHNLHIWWTLVQKRLRTVGEFLPTPKIFALTDTASFTAWTCCVRGNRIWMWNWGSGDADVQWKAGVGGAARNSIAHERMRELTCDKCKKTVVFSGRELTFAFAICHRRSVCRLSVCLSVCL